MILFKKKHFTGVYFNEEKHLSHEFYATNYSKYSKLFEGSLKGVVYFNSETDNGCWSFILFLLAN